jgi:cytochrome c oxidase cbb3-type subunit 3
MATRPEFDEVTGVYTVGHEWDGIKELNNPLPRWWVWVLMATIVWSVGYWIAMPSWPLISSYTEGLLGYSQRATVARSIADAQADKKVYFDRIQTAALADIEKDAELLEFALAGGRSAYAVNCSQCHGAGATGSVGYPNLNDDDWMWGGTLDEIADTIRFGIRSDHEDTRESEMPAFLRDEILTKEQIADVTQFVLSLTNNASDEAAAKRGAPVFAENCAACHREDASGNREFGAPNLRNGIWLYGGAPEDIVATISESRKGVMPAWQGRLDEVTLKLLAVYVHSLGGGEADR